MDGTPQKNNSKKNEEVIEILGIKLPKAHIDRFIKLGELYTQPYGVLEVIKYEISLVENLLKKAESGCVSEEEVNDVIDFLKLDHSLMRNPTARLLVGLVEKWLVSLENV